MALLLTFQVLASTIIICIISQLLRRVPPPLHGHYTRKTAFYNIKKWLVYCYLRLFAKREQLLRRWDPASDASASGCGLAASKEEQRLEDRDDAVEFCCSDAEGNALICGVDPRAGTGWLYVKMQDEELQLPQHSQAVKTRNKLSAGGLHLEPCQPLRNWILTFNGFLRTGKVTNNESKLEPEPVTSGHFKFIWIPCHQELISNKDHRNDWLKAKAIARERWTPNFWRKLNGCYSSNWHEQWGILEGRIKLDGKVDEVHLILRGKKRRTNYSATSNNIHKIVAFDIYAKDGTVIHFNIESFKVGLTENSFGYVIYCDGKYQQLNSCNFSLPDFAEDGSVPQMFNLKLKTNKKIYDLTITINRASKFHATDGVKRNRETHYYLITATVNGINASGFLRVSYPRDLQQLVAIPQPQLQLQEMPSKDRTQLVIPLSDVNCRDGEFVGGKAMSLGLMTTINSANFIIPNGMCVTVTSYWKQLKANPRLTQLIEDLRTECLRNDVTTLPTQCDKVVAAISTTEIISAVSDAIKVAMDKMYGVNFNQMRFAVRSSAVGEDGDETSSAGQNETYLGVKGYNSLYEAISKCWASQFSFQAVQYRRQHGQPVNCGMGVVIQEMVNSKVAGVLFTREPVSGNATQMLITASYGLGESVVSALCDPDTIYINRNWRNEVSIQQRHIGHKQSLITMDDSESGTKKLESTEEQMSNCCLDDEQAIQLAQVGILLENAFGGPRDIEWAYSVMGLHLYLLQSRPITNLDREEDWLVASELNSGPISDDEVYTTANIGEVLPGACSALTTSILQAMLDRTLRTFRHMDTPTSMRLLAWDSFAVFGNHVFFNLTALFNHGINKKLSGQDIGHGHAILGRNIYSDGLHQVLLHRYGSPKLFTKLRLIAPALKQLVYGDSKYRSAGCKALAKVKQQLVFNDSDCASQIFATIDKDMSALYEVAYNQVEVSSASSVWTSVIISILTSKHKEFTSDHIEDLATLLENCTNVVSADVPAAIEKLGDTLTRLPSQTKDFLKDASVEDTLNWLQQDKGRAGAEYREFMQTHGHRGYRELDLFSKSWADDQKSLIHILKTTMKSKSSQKIEKKEPLSLSQTIDSLHTELPAVTKLILRYVLQKSKKCVAYREAMKSVLVQLSGLYRSAYRKLGLKMTEEGRLLNPDLVFFLTHYELGQLIESRSPKLLAKAVRRQAIHPKLDNVHFASMVRGYPKVNLGEDDEENNYVTRKSNLVLKATCASKGKCRGTARVVRSIHDASEIQAGDILITYATDIGWSPYFPLLSGIVTEMGGLVSHGAVVAREYGLPSLIAAENATKLFRSGDEVLLDGSNGTIALISD